MRAAHQASSISGRVHYRRRAPTTEGGVEEREVTICASVFETRQQQCAWVERSPQWIERDPRDAFYSPLILPRILGVPDRIGRDADRSLAGLVLGGNVAA